MSAVHAVRYAGDPSDAPKVENLLKVLTTQKLELEKLMSMLSRLDEWKSNLNKENTRLYKEGELAKEDRKKFESGKVSELELNKKWHTSGRSLRHDQALKSFQEDVADFNVFVKEYNLFTKKMSYVLDKRTPIQIKTLIKNMQKLVRNMREAMDDGNIEKALFIAKQSSIAKEFGYSQQ
jgi:hypothetical protein